MKKLLFVTIFKFLLTVNIFSQYSEVQSFQNPIDVNLNNPQKAVLLELFTSESCFACPPAEMNLAKIEKEQPFEKANVITLEFHVDYRDDFGLKDGLSSAYFTNRQRVYDRKFATGKLYTPQMIVDGEREFTGTSFNKAKKAVARAIKKDKSEIKLKVKNERIYIDISKIPKHDFATVYLAIAEDGLLTRERKSKANVSVVRLLGGLGRILPTQKNFAMDANFQIDENWKKKNIKLVVFVQENRSRKVLGAAKTKLEVTKENHKS